jgi:hypothetical protein
MDRPHRIPNRTGYRPGFDPIKTEAVSFERFWKAADDDGEIRTGSYRYRVPVPLTSSDHGQEVSLGLSLKIEYRQMTAARLGLPILLLVALALIGDVDSFVPATSQCKISTRAFITRIPRFAAPDDDKKEEETAEDEAQRLQKELDSMFERPSTFGGFNPDNFDEKEIPLPLFTATILLLLSVYVTYYMFDVGINGLPEEGPPLIIRALTP